jgi:3-hydroxybutyryl-CoA dehydrogenase
MSSIKRIGVCGSGIMGSGIAEVAAKAGYEVVVRSRLVATAEGMVTQLEKSLTKQVEKGKLAEDEKKAALARVIPTATLEDLADCDLVIESVVEDMETKRHLFRDLDHHCRADTILATNTSTLPVVELAVEVTHPERVVGVHFFNPAPMMSLVEIVRPLTAGDDVVQAVREFAQACGKQPVLVEDRAGFIVNALLFPYLNNAVALWERGTASMEDIDTAMKGGCNFPMGPFALLDLVGLDTSLAILETLHAEFGDPGSKPQPALRRLVAAGRLGRKTGHGFYDYRK